MIWESGIHRVFFICHTHDSDEWIKVSRSGWHGKIKFSSDEVTDPGGTHVWRIELQKFRYCGMAADWFHDMEFTWNTEWQAYFNKSCNCFAQLRVRSGGLPVAVQKRHFHITLSEINDEEWEMPDLFEVASWHWVHKLQRFTVPPPCAPVSFDVQSRCRHSRR